MASFATGSRTGSLIEEFPVQQMTDFEVTTYTWGTEYVRLCLLMRLEEVDRLLISTLMISEGWVTELGLSEAMAIPRSTLRGRVSELIKMGFIQRKPKEGVRLKPAVKSFFILLFREIMEISVKQRRYLSTLLTQVVDDQARNSKSLRPIIVPEELRNPHKDDPERWMTNPMKRREVIQDAAVQTSIEDIN